MASKKTAVERALDVLVYLPVGLAKQVSEDIPKLEERGRRDVESRLSSARVIGQFAVQMARKQAGKQFGDMAAQVIGESLDRFAALSRLAVPLVSPRREPASPGSTAERDVGGESHGESGASERVRSSGVRRGATGTPSEPSKIRERARSNGSGRDVVNVATLAIPAYDSLSASQVVRRLAGLSREELKALSAYEEGTRKRRTILSKVEELLSGES